MARVRFLDQVPVGFYDTNNGGGTGAGFPYSGSAVITGSLLISGSGLTVTGSINADNITGSLFGTASWARNALTASYASNGGVTQLLAGPNITLSPTNGLGQVTITSNGGGGSNFNTATGSYGSFYDTTTQTTPVANIPRSMSFNTTSITNGVLISGSTSPFNTYIKVIDAGVYNIQFSAQVDKTNGGSDDVVIWLRKNGIDLTDTATTLTLPTNNSKVVAAWNWFVTAASNDYYQIIWSSSTTALRLLAESSGTHPGIPSVILTVNRVDQFLSNTGSFSGSFTGNLLGTASWAQNALNADFANSAGEADSAITAQTASFLPVGTYAITASWAQSASNAITASYILNAISSSFATNAITAQTASFLPVGTYAITSSWAQSASNAITSQTASFLPVGTYAITASWAQSASNAITSQTASFISTTNTNAFVQGGNSFGVATSMLGNNDNTNLALETGGSTRIFIDKGGNIGIGSGNAASTQTLYVQGSSAESGNVFAVANSTPTTLFTIQNAGNVGIGITNPRNTLDVNGSTRTTTLSVIGSNTDTLLRIDSPASSSILFVSGSGRVGVGVNNPNANLHTTGTFSLGTGGDSLGQTGAFQYIGSNTFYFNNINGSRGLQILTNTGTINGAIAGGILSARAGSGIILMGDNVRTTYNDLIIASGSGYIGIGTTSPQASLHISGSISQPLLIASSSAGTALFVSGSGNVGINTTSPARRLHVDASGSAVASSPLALTTVDVNNRVGILFGSSSLSSGRQHYLYHRNNIANVEWILDSGGAGNAQWQFQPRDDTSYGFSILTPYNKGTVILTTGINQSGIEIRPGTTSNVLFLQSGSGNVGIGTSTPSASLHISGGNMILEGSMSFSDPAKTISGLVGSAFTIKSTNNSIDIQAGSINTIRVNPVAGRLLLIPTTYGASFPTDNTYRTQIYSNTPDTGALYISSSNVAINVDTPGNTNLLYISGSQVSVGSNTQTGARLYVNGTTLTNGNVVIYGNSATNNNALAVYNSTPTSLFTIQNNGQFIIGSPTMSIAASQSAFSINHQISASNVVGGQYYGINYTPTFWQTTASQTETAFRIAATFTQSSAAATSGSNIIADFGAVNVGSQLTVTDVTSGSIYMVNDVSGLPIIEATSDWSVNMYNYPNIVFRKTGSSILITGSLNVTGSLNMSPTSSFVLPLTSSSSPQTGSAFWSGSFLYVYDGTRYRSSSFA